jgi:hypothetical protein
MKKILIGLLCLNTSVIASESNSKPFLTVNNKPFNGFYAGVFSGYTNRSVNTRANNTDTEVIKWSFEKIEICVSTYDPKPGSLCLFFTRILDYSVE